MTRLRPSYMPEPKTNGGMFLFECADVARMLHAVSTDHWKRHIAETAGVVSETADPFADWRVERYPSSRARRAERARIRILAANVSESHWE